ncbi:MAG: hypothetical protein KC454_05470 [Flavobacteriales bacterium]|nr:hypothetical protein [Flavobacteriales bacterium]
MGTIAQLFESGKKAADKGLFNNLVMLARVDAAIDDAEVKLLTRIAKRLSLTNEQVSEIIEHPESYPMVPPSSKEERYERFILFIQMVVVDGDVDPEEQKLVIKYGLSLGFKQSQIEELEPKVLKLAKAGVIRSEILDQVM